MLIVHYPQIAYNLSMDDNINKLEARKLLIQSRLYKYSAFVFAFFGFALFSYLYSQKFTDGVWAAFRDPLIIFVIIVPFIPAIVLSWLSRRLEIKLKKVFTKSDE